MKQIILFFFVLSANYAFSQQSFSANFVNDLNGQVKRDPLVQSNLMAGKFFSYKKEHKGPLKKEEKEYRKNLKLNLPVFGIEGIGNLNQEALKSYNAAGKISLYARPVQFRNNTLTIYASYNKSASNNDSVLSQKLIFPEIGSSAFTGTIELDKIWNHNTVKWYPDTITSHSLSPFFEFCYKKINSDSSAENQQLHFTSLNYTFGVKYIFGYSKLDLNDDTKTKTINLSFFAIPFISFLNIPNEDTVDYRALLTRNVKLTVPGAVLTDNIATAGIKIGFQINNLQVFADFRSVLNKRENVPIRELQGFHANIGLVFNADVLEFRK